MTTDKHTDTEAQLQAEFEEFMLTRMGWNELPPAERVMLDLAMDQFRNYRAAKREIETHGYVTESDGRHGLIRKANPAIDAQDKALKNLINLMDKLDVIHKTNRNAAQHTADFQDQFDPGARPGAF